MNQRETEASDLVGRLGGAMTEAYDVPAVYVGRNGRAAPVSAATGAVNPPATLRAYAAEAGFREAEVLPTESDAFRFYRLVG